MKNEIKEIHRLLNRISINPEDFASWLSSNDAALEKTLEPLSNYLKKHFPPKLYRMRVCTENSISAFETDSLYLTRADHFNDPYDCMVCFDADALRQRIEDYISADNLRSFLEKTNKINFKDSPLFTSVNDCIDNLTKIKKEFLESVYDNFSSASEFLQKSTYIACFAESVNCPAMWAHYSDYHKGFAIEYQFESGFYSPAPFFVSSQGHEKYGFRSLLPVIYSNKKANGDMLAEWYCLCEMHKSLQNDFDFSMISPDLLLKTKLSLCKAKVWEYEKEWRLIITHEWPNHLEEQKIHIKAVPRAIYLGSRIDNKYAERLTEIATFKGISVYKMHISYTAKEFEMYHKKLI